VETIRHKRKDKEVFLHQKELVFDFQGGVPPGSWSFPFSLDLPAWCPSSVFLTGKKESKLQMSYKIAAEIMSNGGQDVIEAKRRIIVRRPPFEMKTGHNLESAQEIKECCCIDKGKADMKVNFEKNAYTPYETAKCFVEVNNTECKIPIENVTFKLKRAVTATANGHNLHLDDFTLAT
jgi:hypothetical protein